ncbi:MAG: prolyl oligopeptidase family serine peptidase [Candidatus Hydrogenedentes bacterium]|nr:prolyl oligopeptidase family serine peptidase [Candidatus Hydrogenedentota bacterium]
MSYLWYWPAGGWDFDKWKKRHPWKPITTTQSGTRDLEPLIPRGGGLRDWKKRREEILATTGAILGTLTDRPPRKFKFDVLEQRRHDTYRLQRVRYTLTDSEWGYAWLLTPPGKRKRPAVIALHQTVQQGKDEPVGIEGSDSLAYARDLANEGFVVLAPDAIGFGERAKDLPTAFYHSGGEFFGRHPEGSAMGKMAFDTSRAVDLLDRLPEVNAKHIGCIGHSHGGYGTLFAMIADDRIKAGVISCGVTVLRHDPTPQRWWRMTALMPRLGYYEGHINDAPLDFHHLLALVAPRPLMLSAALSDAIFPNTEILKEVSHCVRNIYQLYGAQEQFTRWIFKGDHRFPNQARIRAYRMLKNALGLAE